MSLTMQPNASIRWINRTISLFRSPNFGGGNGARTPAKRGVGVPTPPAEALCSSSVIARSRRLASSSKTSGAMRGIRAFARSSEKDFMSLDRSPRS